MNGNDGIADGDINRRSGYGMADGWVVPLHILGEELKGLVFGIITFSRMVLSFLT